jgi:DnaJ-class molecular chaperone
MSNLNKLEFYKLFNIDKINFNESDLKKAYYRLSLKYQPEKGSKMGDMIKYVNKAYEILSNSEKRKIYNEHGMEAFNGVEIKDEYLKFIEKSSPHKKLNDFEVSIFDDLNESSLFRYDESSEDLTNDVLNYSYLSTGVKYEEEEVVGDILPKLNNYKIDVTLEELYRGCEKQIEIQRKIICPECFGNNETYVVCDSCLGSGVTYNVNFEQELPCKDCSGYGKRKVIREKCSNCNGEVTIYESKNLVAHIRPGMKHNEKIIFKGEGDQSLQSPPEDIVAYINVLPHPQYSYSGNDLIINVKITLKEALCGLRRRIKFLDGSYLSIMTNPGEVITPNSVKSYKHKGLIKNVGSKVKGNLKIKFHVQFPENNWTSLEDIKILENILGKSSSDKSMTNENKYLSVKREHTKREYHLEKRKDYPSPETSLSSLSINSSGSSNSNNSTGVKKLQHKKSVIDTFYQCDIEAEGEKMPRTISVVDPSKLKEINPPRTVSVIDSVIMPLPGDNSMSSYNDDDEEIENYSEVNPSPSMSLRRSPLSKPIQTSTPTPTPAQNPIATPKPNSPLAPLTPSKMNSSSSSPSSSSSIPVPTMPIPAVPTTMNNSLPPHKSNPTVTHSMVNSSSIPVPTMPIPPVPSKANSLTSSSASISSSSSNTNTTTTASNNKMLVNRSSSVKSVKKHHKSVMVRSASLKNIKTTMALNNSNNNNTNSNNNKTSPKHNNIKVTHNPMSGRVSPSPMSGRVSPNPMSGRVSPNPMSGRVSPNPMSGRVSPSPMSSVKVSTPMTTKVTTNPISIKASPTKIIPNQMNDKVLPSPMSAKIISNPMSAKLSTSPLSAKVLPSPMSIDVDVDVNVKATPVSSSISTSPSHKATQPSIKTSPSHKATQPVIKTKTSQNLQAVRRNDDKGVIYTNEETFKTIKVVPNKTAVVINKNVKSPKELELAECNNKKVIDNSKNEFVPPPLPPFPKITNKHLNHTRSSSLEHNYFKNSYNFTSNNNNNNNNTNSNTTNNSNTLPSKGNILKHSNTFHSKERSPKSSAAAMNFGHRSNTMELINYSHSHKNQIKFFFFFFFFLIIYNRIIKLI